MTLRQAYAAPDPYQLLPNVVTTSRLPVSFHCSRSEQECVLNVYPLLIETRVLVNT
jgi:hypothetical protein